MRWVDVLRSVARVTLALIVASNPSSCSSSSAESGAEPNDASATDGNTPSEAGVCPNASPGIISVCIAGPLPTQSADGGVPAFTGVVTRIIPGTETCVADGLAYDFSGWTFVVSDGTGTVAVGITDRWRVPFVTSGQRVSLTSAPGSPYRRNLTVRAEDGSLLFWFYGFESGSTTVRGPDGIEAQLGAPVCSWKNGCDTGSRYAVNVNVGGSSVDLAEGEAHESGSYVAAHGGGAVGTECYGDGAMETRLGVAVIKGTLGTLKRAASCGGTQCGTDEYCAVPVGPEQCFDGDAAGQCQKAPTNCPSECSRVCGCDGRVYCNACLAMQAGVSVADGLAAIAQDRCQPK